MRLLRRAVFLGLASFIVCVALAPGLAGAATTEPCGQSCGASNTPASNTSVAATGTKPGPANCVRDVSCGGGAALSTGTLLFVFALAAGLGAAALILPGRRIVTHLAALPRGALLAARLFHPPRLALGI